MVANPLLSVSYDSPRNVGESISLSVHKESGGEEPAYLASKPAALSASPKAVLGQKRPGPLRESQNLGSVNWHLRQQKANPQATTTRARSSAVQAVGAGDAGGCLNWYCRQKEAVDQAKLRHFAVVRAAACTQQKSAGTATVPPQDLGCVSWHLRQQLRARAGAGTEGAGATAGAGTEGAGAGAIAGAGTALQQQQATRVGSSASSMAETSPGGLGSLAWHQLQADVFKLKRQRGAVVHAMASDEPETKRAVLFTR
jgi:hypothetical protein